MTQDQKQAQELIKQILASGMKPEKLATEMEVSLTTISLWKNGTRTPSKWELEGLHSLLNKRGGC